MMYSLPLVALIISAAVNSVSGGLLQLQFNTSLEVNLPVLYNNVVLTAKNDVNFFLSGEIDITAESSVRFYCGNRKRPELQLTLPDRYDLQVKLDINKSIMFVVHGWTESSTNQYIQDAVHDALALLDINVCTIDWTILARYEYEASVNHTWIVSDQAVKFIKIAFELGVTPQSIILVGHGLGAHICGQIGYKFNGTIGQIYGLDPARTNNNSQSSNLDKTDAEYVQVIMSSNGTMSSTVDGHEVFYLNAGSAPQPNCGSLTIDSDIVYAQVLLCSHYHAYNIFRLSMNSVLVYPARSCGSWADYMAGKCFSLFNRVTRIGIYSTKQGGVFYLKTTSRPPYNLF